MRGCSHNAYTYVLMQFLFGIITQHRDVQQKLSHSFGHNFRSHFAKMICTRVFYSICIKVCHRMPLTTRSHAIFVKRMPKTFPCAWKSKTPTRRDTEKIWTKITKATAKAESKEKKKWITNLQNRHKNMSIHRAVSAEVSFRFHREETRKCLAKEKTTSSWIVLIIVERSEYWMHKHQQIIYRWTRVHPNGSHVRL